MKVVLPLRLVTAMMSLALVGCAIPRDHHTFSVYAPGSEQNPFLSTDALLTNGLVSESISYGTKGRLFEAESRLRKALYLDSNNDGIRFNLAVVIGQGGNAEEALEILTSLRSSLGEQPYLLIATADIYNARGDRERARTELKKAFSTYRSAANDAQAAIIARSISNLAFAQGLEQEALCYSWEALSLAPSPQQLGAHAGLLVGLNMFSAAESYTKSRIKEAPALGASVQVHYGLSLAYVGRGDIPGALREIEVAQDLLAENPEVGTEVNSLWYILKSLSPDPEDTEATRQKIQQARLDASRLRDQPPYALARWPAAARDLLNKVSDPE
jgi:tetratricopeptide (TPR) repeat protein